LIAVALGCAMATQAGAGSRPDAHAPIGVMGDHTHEPGEWMFSYRYMRMGMNGMRDNDESISRSKVLEDYPVTPTSMDMEMHMVGAMYAPIERLTLTLMLPWVRLEMDHRTRTGATFTTRSDGIGDLRVGGLVDLWQGDAHHIHANLGLSIPTGSLSQEDNTPRPTGSDRLPYPMQIGTGTWDFLPGLTYRGELRAFSWGAQARGEVRMNENHAGYRVGNEYALTAWGAYELADWVSTSLRLEWLHSMNYRGREQSEAVNPAVVPTADPGRRAVRRLDALLGFNFIVPHGRFSGIRFAVEAGIPAFQHLDGPQLETDWMLTTGVQYAF
jgi:hypothetical protein